MIEVAGLARGCCLLIMAELKQTGFTHLVNGAVELSPAASELNRFMGTELSALKAVGLGRRAKQVTSLAEYLSNGKAAPVETNTIPSHEQVAPSQPPSP